MRTHDEAIGQLSDNEKLGITGGDWFEKEWGLDLLLAVGAGILAETPLAVPLLVGVAVVSVT